MSNRIPHITAHGQVPTDPLTVWLSIEQIRKMERMRRQRVIEAMESGDLPYEQRGRIRYARLRDVLAWETARLERRPQAAQGRHLRSDIAGLL